MAKWTLEEHLTFDIAFALKTVTIPGFRKALTEETSRWDRENNPRSPQALPLAVFEAFGARAIRTCSSSEPCFRLPLIKPCKAGTVDQ